MFVDINKFPQLKIIQENCSIISQELADAILKDDKVRAILNPIDSDLENYTDYWVKDNGFHEEQMGYDIRKGEYTTMAVFKKNYTIKHFDVNELFPKTMNLLRSIDNIHYSAFFKMYPKTKLDAHTHNRSHLIFHLLLNDLENGDFYLRCGNESKTLKNKGDYMIFDYSNEHESANNSDSERLHFIIDFNPVER